MELVLTEEHELTQRAARDFVASRSPLKRTRAGECSRDLWKEMARLGWMGLGLPEAHGGSGGHVYQMLVLEELGRGLVPEPFVATVLLGAAAVARAGSEAQQAAILPPVIEGERLLALAYEEPGMRYAWTRTTTRATRGDGGWHLTGAKTRVLGGADADTFIVLARSDEGLGLFLVPAGATEVQRQQLLDGRAAAQVAFTSAPAELLGEAGGGEAVLTRVLDAAAIGLGAEMVGGMAAVFDMTLAYLKTRVQFGKVIGTFQALQHRAGRLYMDVELCRAAVWSGHALLDAGAGDAEVARAASIVKARCSDAFVRVVEEGIQLHGGIGMTDEHDVGLYARRARVSEVLFGDAAYHRDRFARLGGF